MFKRRNPTNFFHNVRQVIWPKMGWWRVIKYYRFRIVRLSSSAESIAVNLAGGSAMSLTPFFGIHVFGALGFAWLIGARMNLIAAMVGTFVGNPWTFPFFLYAEHALGSWILSLIGTQGHSNDFDPDKLIEQQNEGFWNVITFLSENFTDIFIPTAIGGTILAILSYPLFYLFYFYTVRGAQRARKLRLKKKQRELFNRKSKGD